MPGIKVGDVIGVQCRVQPGPFSEERLVSFDTVDGPVSGFVREANLREVEGQWFVRAVVQGIHDEDILEVRVRGSFFTTNGLANVERRFAMAA
jgi:hypothetical protein